MAFTETFGGTTIYPSDVSYRSISLSANQELSWPLEVATSGNVVAQIMDVTPSAGGFTITMPPANEASPGETALFFNAGSFNFTVADNAGNTIVAITPGLAYQVYLTTNTTVAGTWRTTQFGAGTSSATAGSLVGAGIKAINTTLNQSMAVTSLSVNYTAGAADRSAAFLWTGGAGTITLPAASTVGNDWFFHIRNGGTGAISLATTGGELINGTATVDFNPGDSAIIVCDGTGYFTIGFGQAPEFLFDYVSIDLTSQSSPYTLAGSNLNRIAYQFSGTLTTNMEIIVPATIQQYWVGNFTTGGSYTLTVKTSAGTGVVVPRDARAILYCNGTDVVTADTGGISIPILVSQGGTGATNASSARTNLGATSIGNALFIAVDEATARNAIIAAKSGANSDITSLTGLTTPLSVPQGGTGASTFTANGLIYGSGTSALGVTAVGTTGQVLVGNTGGAPSWATLSGIGVTSFSAGTTGLTPSAATSGAITLAGTLIVANGGTGATTLTGYVKGSGTSALTASATIPATDISGGAALTKTDDTNVTLTLGGTPASALLAATSLTLGWSGQLSVARGGTGQSSYTDGQLLIGNSTGNTLTKATLTAGTNVSITNGAGSITINATDQFVGTVTSVDVSGGTTGLTTSGGPITTSGTITLAGTLNVANGGTGATSLTSGYLVKGNGTSAVSASVIRDDGTNIAIGTAPAANIRVYVRTAAITDTAYYADNGSNSGFTVKFASSLTSIGNDFGSPLALLTNNTERMRIDSSGNVGIGTSSPTVKLDVAGGVNNTGAFRSISGTVDAIFGAAQFASGVVGIGSVSNHPITFNTNLTENMRITTAGNVGIGTSSPGYKLQVNGTMAGVVASGVNYEAIRTSDFYYMTVSADGLNTLTDVNGSAPMLFKTGGTERMRVTSAGLVGIGTSSPANNLQVSAAVANTPTTFNVNHGASGNSFDYAASTVSATGGLTGGLTAWGTGSLRAGTLAVGTGTNHPMTFMTNDNERMRIDASGNVSIGTTATSSAFCVARGAGVAAAISLRGGNVAEASEFWVAQGSGGTEAYLYNRANGPMIFGTNNTERARIDSSGNLLVNTTTAIEKLTIGSTTATSSGINQRTTQTDFAIKPSNTAAGGVTLEVGWVAGGQGPLIFNLGGEKARIDSSGNLLVGTTTSSYTDANSVVISPSTYSGQINVQHATGSGSGNGFMVFTYAVNQIGSISQNGTTGVLFNTSSDVRLKENITDADDAASLIDAIQVRKFDWKADGSHQRYGFVAQELVTVAPEAVSQPADPDDMMGVDYSKLVPMLVKEIQSLRARVAQLEGN